LNLYTPPEPVGLNLYCLPEWVCQNLYSLPEWVWLTNLTYRGGAVAISGKALSNNLIADLINNLQNSSFFTNVQITSSSRRKEAGIDIFEFRINCVFVPRPETKKAEKNIGRFVQLFVEN